MSKIKSIKAQQILDSRKKPTLKVKLITGKGSFSASVPAGTSDGKFEAKAKEARVAVRKIEQVIAKKLIGKSVVDQKALDDFLIKLDGTKDKSNLGANAILAISVASLRAGAEAQGLVLWQWIAKLAKTKPALPTPAVLFMEGGLHGTNSLGVQEVMATFPGNSFKEKFIAAKNAFEKLGKFLPKRYGLEGAYAAKLNSTEEALDLLVGVAPEAKLILDVAASHDEVKSVDYYFKLAKKYPIYALEDPFPEEAWTEWPKLYTKFKNLKPKKWLIGDDLTVTNPLRIKKAYAHQACNGVVIKPNQIGTVSETITAAKLAKSFNWKLMVSHRSGETMDDFIADLAVGLGADLIKAGAPTKSERMVKYNRLLNIEKEAW